MEPSEHTYGVGRASDWPAPRGRPRFAFDPLEQLAPAGTVTALAGLLGCSPRSIYRWRESGLPWWSADRVAVALDLHPVLVWPEWERIAE